MQQSGKSMVCGSHIAGSLDIVCPLRDMWVERMAKASDSRPVGI